MNSPVLVMEYDIDEGPSDMEIVFLIAVNFDLTPDQAIDRLQGIDFQTARGGMQ